MRYPASPLLSSFGTTPISPERDYRVGLDSCFMYHGNMNANLDIAPIGALIGAPARAAMLVALMDGRLLPAGELAFQAYVSPQAASAHLCKLVEGGLLEVEVCGRHRYYRLANAEVGQVIESMMTFAAPVPLRPLPEREGLKQLRFARSCYDHLAGKLGIMFTHALVDHGLLEENPEQDFTLTAAGENWFQEIGIDLHTLKRQRRAFARRCLDWSERRYHLGGALGSATMAWMFELGWITRIRKSRALRVTEVGRRELLRKFDLRI